MLHILGKPLHLLGENNVCRGGHTSSGSKIYPSSPWGIWWAGIQKISWMDEEAGSAEPCSHGLRSLSMNFSDWMMSEDARQPHPTEYK